MPRVLELVLVFMVQRRHEVIGVTLGLPCGRTLGIGRKADHGARCDSARRVRRVAHRYRGAGERRPDATRLTIPRPLSGRLSMCRMKVAARLTTGAAASVRPAPVERERRAGSCTEDPRTTCRRPLAS